MGDGRQLQPHRRLLQQGARRQDRDEEPPKTLAELDALPREGEGGRDHSDRAVQRRGDGRPPLPAPAADVRLRPVGPINSWIFNKAGANIDTATNLAAINHLDGWIKDGYFN